MMFYGSGTWGDWCSTTATTSTTSNAWEYWTGGTYTSSTATATAVWTAWADEGTSNYYAQPVRARPYVPPQPTKKELEERARRAEEARSIEERRRKEAEEALIRAEQLLQEVLDANQRKEYAKDKSFHVIGADGERYKIRPAWSGHIERVVNGKSVERFCIHPRQDVPVPDNQLIAKLMLETDPLGMKRIANRTQLATA